MEQNIEHIQKPGFSRYKKLLFLAIGVIVVISLISLLVSLIFNNNTPKKPDQTQNSIIKTMPANNAVNVGLSTPITLTFYEPLSDVERNSLHVFTTPSIPLSLQILSDNKTVTILPSQSLDMNKKYIVKVLYSDNTYTWSFSTIPSPTGTFDQVMQKQSESDKNFGQWQQNIYQNYPWYNSLPLQTDHYFVYFDLDSKLFVAKLYPQRNTATSISQQVSGFKQEIISRLQGLGIQTEKYEFSWTVIPK